jgi:hypothetical protein
MNMDDLSFDGRGVNLLTGYHPRLATFTPRAISAGEAERYGPLFKAAPRLLAALEQIVKCEEERRKALRTGSPAAQFSDARLKEAREAIAEAKGDGRDTRGKIAYEADVRRRPTYDGGLPRPTWEQLCPVARWSWERRPELEETEG